MSVKIRIMVALLAGLCLLGGTSWAATPPPGEEALFTTSTAPDTLIVLDLSQSMNLGEFLLQWDILQLL
jgi:hypothetical protein